MPQKRKDAPSDTTVPDWITTTPGNHSFELLAHCEYEGELQSVKVTHAEFITLKKHLAQIRGLPVDADSHR